MKQYEIKPFSKHNVIVHYADGALKQTEAMIIQDYGLHKKIITPYEGADILLTSIDRIYIELNDVKHLLNEN